MKELTDDLLLLRRRAVRKLSNHPVANRSQFQDKLILPRNPPSRDSKLVRESRRRVLPEERRRILQVPQQFGLNVRRLAHVNPFTRVRQAINAR